MIKHNYNQTLAQVLLTNSTKAKPRWVLEPVLSSEVFFGSLMAFTPVNTLNKDEYKIIFFYLVYSEIKNNLEFKIRKHYSNYEILSEHGQPT